MNKKIRKIFDDYPENTTIDSILSIFLDYEIDISNWS